MTGAVEWALVHMIHLHSQFSNIMASICDFDKPSIQLAKR